MVSFVHPKASLDRVGLSNVTPPGLGSPKSGIALPAPMNHP